MGMFISGSSTSTGSFHELHIKDRIGIGRTDPQYALDVYNNGSSTEVAIGKYAAGKAVAMLGTSADTNGYFQIQSYYAQGSTFGDIILNPQGGDVGIGDSSPSYKLDVAGTGRFTGALHGNSGLTISGAHSTFTGTIYAEQGNTGTLNGDGANLGGLIDLSLGRQSTNNGTRIKLESGHAHGEFIIQARGSTTYSTGNIGIYRRTAATTFGTIMHIGGDGKIGIGTESPVDKLTVSGNVTQIDGSPEYHFGTTSASHYNWRIATQETVDGGFEIASGTQSAGTNAPSDTYSTRFIIAGGSGKVSIGTTGAYGQVTIGNTGEQLSLRATSGTAKLAFYEAGTTRGVLETVNGQGGLYIKTPSDIAASFVGTTVEFPTATKISGSSSSTGSFGRVEIAGKLKTPGYSDVDSAIQSLTSGGISKSGTPVDNQVAVFTGANQIEGSGNLTFTSNLLATDVGAPGSADKTLFKASSAASSRDIGFVWDDSLSTLGVATLTSHKLVFHTGGNSNPRMTLDTSGHVGIGINAPAYQLHLYEPSAAAELTFERNSSAANIGIINWKNDNGNVIAKIHADSHNATAGRIMIGTSGDFSALKVETDGSVHMTKNLIVAGKVTAQEFHTEFVSASIMYESGSTQFGDTSGDTHKFTGLVGINETSPDEALHITSTAASATPVILLENSNANNLAPQLNLYNNSASPADGDYVGQIDFEGNDSGDNRTQYARIIATSTDVTNTIEDGILDFNVMYNGTLTNGLRLRGMSNGAWVGIGESNPDANLHIKGSAYGRIKLETTGTNSHPIMFFTNDARTYDVRIDGSTDNFAVYDDTAAAYRFVINSSGNVGIGTTAPAKQLSIMYPSYIAKTDVQGLIRLVGQSNDEYTGDQFSAGTAIEFYNKWSGGAEYSVGRIAGRAAQSYDGGLQFDVSQNGAAGQSNFSTAMVILDTGLVGIGTTSPTSGRQLEVHSDTDTYIQISTSNAGADTWLKFRNDGDDDSNTDYRMGRNNAGTFIFGDGDGDTHYSIASNGDITFGSVTKTSHAKVTIQSNADNNYDAILQFNQETTMAWQLYNDASDSDKFKIGDDDGTVRMTVMQSGNVGIGTTTPGQKLEVNGTVQIGADLRLYNGTSIRFHGNGVVGMNGTATTQTFGSTAGSVNSHFNVGGVTAAMVISGSTGNVGIGTTTPGSKLEILTSVANGSNYDVIKLDGNTGNYGSMWIAGEWANGAQGKIGFYGTSTSAGTRGVALVGDGGNSPHFFVNSGGFTGLNTTSPLNILHVMGASAEGAVGSTNADSIALFQNNVNASDQCYITLVGGTTGGAGFHFGDKDDSDAGIIKYDLYTAGGGGFEFWAEGTERMSILANGHVGIGTSSPDVKFHVMAGSAGTVDSYSGVHFTLESSANTAMQFLTAENSDTRIWFGDAANNTAGGILYTHNATATAEHMELRVNAATRLKILGSGNVGIGTTSPDYQLELEQAGGAFLSLKTTDTDLQNNDVLGTIQFAADDATHSGIDIGAKIVATVTDNYQSAGSNVDAPTRLDFFTQDNTTTDVMSTVGATLTLGGDDQSSIFRGAVGISTTPERSLHVNAQTGDYVAKFESSDGYAGIILEDNSSTTDGNRIAAIGDSLRFDVGGSAKVYIDSNGLGIGGSPGAAGLDVSSGHISLDYSYALSFEGPGGNTSITSNATDTLAFLTGGSNRMAINANGNIIIAHTAPAGMANSSYKQIALNSGAVIADSGGTNSAFMLLQNAYVGASNNNYRTVNSKTSRIMMTTGDISFATAGADSADSGISWDTRMFIEESNGYVGIGTETPGQKLEVNGYAKATRGMFGNTTIGNWSNSDRIETNGDELTIGTHSSHNVVFRAAANDRMTISGSNGHIGIGTSTPDSMLHLESSVDYNPTLIIENTNANSRSPFLRLKKTSSSPAANDGIGKIEFYGNDSTSSSRLMAFIEAFTPDVSNSSYDGAIRLSTMVNTTQTETVTIRDGRVGIRNTSPADPLHIYNASGATINFDTAATSNWRVGATSYLGGYSTGNAFAWYNMDSSAYVMTISGSGNVGIGTATPDALLHLSSANTAIKVETTNAANVAMVRFQTNGNDWYWAAGGSSQGYFPNKMYLYNESTGNNPMTILNNSRVGIGSNNRSPSYQLDNNGTARTTGKAYFENFVSITPSWGRIGIGMNGFTDPDYTIHAKIPNGVGSSTVSSANLMNNNTMGIVIENANNGANTGMKLGFRSTGTYTGDTFIWHENTGTDGQGRMAFWTEDGGTAYERIRINHNGAVGIGSTQTDRKLSVAGTARFDGAVDFSANIHIASGYNLFLDGGSNTYIKENGADTMTFTTAGTERVRITQGGNVGIGSTSPNGKLVVNAGAAEGSAWFHRTGASGGDHNILISTEEVANNRNQILFATGGVNGGGGESSTTCFGIISATIKEGTLVPLKGQMDFKVNTGDSLTTAITIDKAAKVGIGVTDPDSKLEVNGNVKIDGGDRAILFGGQNMKIVGNTSTPALEIRGGVSGQVKVYCDETLRWTFDDGGDLSSSGNHISTGGKISVGSGTESQPGYQLGSSNDGFFHDGGIKVVVNNAVDFLMADGGTFHADADVVAYSTTISDERLKDDVKTIDSALDKVKRLRGVEYVWSHGSKKGQKDIGVIAQETEKVIPEIVQEKEMPLWAAKDSEINGKYKMVDYEKLTAVLIESVKEQQEQIDELKSEIEELKNGMSK